MYNRILIANRGEIALRVIRACKEMGIETVAVFSEGDRGSRYLELADEAYCIGGAKSSESYLKIDQIVSAAEVGNVEAVHPGYGFLAENAHFNEVCRDCNIDFIGPTPEAMAMLGDKNEARALARKAKVPVVPGSEGLIADEETALKVAHEIGFPVLIKATAGGGGRGMRVAANDLALKSAFHQATTEALAAFGNGGVYLEKYIEHPRHVEVQMLADAHGTAVHLWERDCSTQRRHQKLIEESPSPAIPKNVRKSICDAAVRLIQSANYTNAGTVEFIVDANNNFYFIEVNARIQVEHPVSEMVTGIDLIQQQIRIAAGEKLPFKQKDIPCLGAAIECRINAEDPAKNFQPCPGRIDNLFIPGGLGVRFDSHVHAGYVVPPYYDSMIGKLIVHKPTREEAINCMLRALAELRVSGIKTTTDFHRQVLSHKDFTEAKIDTGWVERNLLARV
jgi:acetyl-CoA carboxylase biotin carboxylase subunit